MNSKSIMKILVMILCILILAIIVSVVIKIDRNNKNKKENDFIAKDIYEYIEKYGSDDGNELVDGDGEEALDIVDLKNFYLAAEHIKNYDDVEDLYNKIQDTVKKDGDTSSSMNIENVQYTDNTLSFDVVSDINSYGVIISNNKVDIYKLNSNDETNNDEASNKDDNKKDNESKN